MAAYFEESVERKYVLEMICLERKNTLGVGCNDGGSERCVGDGLRSRSWIGLGVGIVIIEGFSDIAMLGKAGATVKSGILDGFVDEGERIEKGETL